MQEAMKAVINKEKLDMKMEDAMKGGVKDKLKKVRK